MLFVLPVLVLLLAATILLVLHRIRPNFKYPWFIALVGSLLAVAGVLLWKLDFPAQFSLPAWQPVNVLRFIPTWAVDGTSWTYALALVTLAAAVILTSVARAEKVPTHWAGTLALTALGILCVSAGDPLTLIMVWTAMDLVELITMLRTTEGVVPTRSVITAFSVRVVGTGLVIWADASSSTTLGAMSFERLAAHSGIYLILAAGLRLGVLPLHLPYQRENVVRRGFGTSLRLISAAASLILLARTPSSALNPAWTPYLLALTAIPALYAGWMWMRASDEITGRPFWIIGVAALAVASSLRANPAGSISWGLALILCGGMIFLYSSRHRSILWIPLLGLWGLSALPFSPSAGAWTSPNSASWLLLLLFLPAQALLLAGYFRHTSHPGEKSFESQERWTRIFYPAGLLLLAACTILLGVWGWEGALQVGAWWAGVPVFLFAMGLVYLSGRYLARSPGTVTRWGDVIRLEPVYRAINAILRAFENLARLVTSTLEGDGGIFWSILLLILILSLFSARGGG
jgi:hypothetical protein